MRVVTNRGGQHRMAVVLLTLAYVALVAFPVTVFGTYAGWNSGTTVSNTLSTRKVFSTTVSSPFLDYNDATTGAPTGKQQAGTMYLDGNTALTNNTLSPTFNTLYYEEIDFGAPDLPADVATGSAMFNFSFTNPAAGETTCFYFVTLRLSDSTVLGTHGSSGSPVGCVSTTTVTTFNTALPEVSSTTVMQNSFAVRMYVTNSASDKMSIDSASLTGNLLYNNGTQTYSTFTEYEESRQSHEPGGNASPLWALSLLDGPTTAGSAHKFSTAFPISGSYTPSKYAEFDQNAGLNFIPNGATITGSSVSLTYIESTAGGNVMCVQMDVYVNGTDIGPFTATGANCSSSATTETTFTADTTAGIATASAANNVYVRVTGKNSTTSAQIKVDYVSLSVTYSLT